MEEAPGATLPDPAASRERSSHYLQMRSVIRCHTSARSSRAAIFLSAVLLLLGAAAGSTEAQHPVWLDSLRAHDTFDFYASGPYRTGVPRPDSLLGYSIGMRQTQYADQQRVLQAIAAAASDRVHVEEFGATAEGRVMRLYVVSAPENIARLDQIRANLESLGDSRRTNEQAAAQLAAQTPAVVMLSFSVHGNESPGFEAAMSVLYQLAAGEDANTQQALRNTVVVINPSSNPDGHERFAVWYNSVAMGNPDFAALEHSEPWSIQGRFNHYRFDMNRDVMSSTQAEVKAIVGAMLRWKPQVAVDLHGQTTQYFFPPAARPVHQHIAGSLSEKWMTAIGGGNAAAFDQNGWLYFVRDQFDLYYPGYFDTWPSLTGATGMTYETDGGGWKGLLYRRDDESLLSFRDGISKHHVAALATIGTVAERSAERLEDWATFRRQAVASGRSDRMRRIVWDGVERPKRAAELAAALMRSGIEVRRVDSEFASARAHAYSGGRVQGRRFPVGSYVVDLAQPHGRMARAMLEPVAAMDVEFARTQLDRFRRNQQRSSGTEGFEFYDVTAWSLPVAFGLEAWWTEDAQALSGDLLSLPPAPTGAAAISQAAFGTERLPVDIPGGVVGGAARTAYLFTPERTMSATLAYRLMEEGFRVSVAAEPIEADGFAYSRGSYVVRVNRNDSTLHQRIAQLASETGVAVRAANTAWAGQQQFGIGSGWVVPLKQPRIAMVADEGISQTSYGAIWWTLERRYRIPFTALTWNRLSGSLSRFDVLIIPSGSAGSISSRLGSAGTERLRDWVRAGGTLVTMSGSAAWAATEAANLTSTRLVSASDDSSERATAEDAEGSERRQVDSLLAVTSPGAEDRPAPVPGAHFEARIDRTHWLTFGYERPNLTLMVDGRNFFTLSKEGVNIAAFPEEDGFHRAGFVWPNNTERLLRGTAAIVAEPLGQGHVILFQQEPLFRGWWRSLDGMFLNALLLGPAF